MDINEGKYAEETRMAEFQGGTITVTHLTPVLTPEEYQKQRREIEGKLYDIFAKYAERKRGAAPETAVEAVSVVSVAEIKT